MSRLALLCLLVGCPWQRRGEPLVGVIPLAADEARGQVVFMANCTSCHPGGEAGLGPTLTGSPTPVWMQRHQVRLGAGAMPAFGPEEIGRADLRALTAYLRAVKHHELPPREAR